MDSWTKQNQKKLKHANFNSWWTILSSPQLCKKQLRGFLSHLRPSSQSGTHSPSTNQSQNFRCHKTIGFPSSKLCLSQRKLTSTPADFLMEISKSLMVKTSSTLKSSLLKSSIKTRFLIASTIRVRPSGQNRFLYLAVSSRSPNSKCLRWWTGASKCWPKPQRRWATI